MSTRNDRNKRWRSRERSPLRPGRHSTSYGSAGPFPRSPGPNPPPPYRADPGYTGGGYQTTNAYHYQQDKSLDKLTKGRIVGTVIIFLFVAQLVAFGFFYNLPTKLGRYSEATARMRVQEVAMRKEAKHVESERIALRGESTRLEKERLALESSTMKMEGERKALESAIRHSEVERSRLEKQEQRLEDERQLSEQERLALKEERQKWEKAREDRVPQGAFWEAVWPSLDCRSYGTREYWGALRNIPEGWTDLDACMNMPVEIKGVSVRRPDRCGFVEGSPGIHGFWTVDWDQPECKPWHQDFNDKGCTNPGSGIRRIEAWVVGINTKGGQDWRLLCESTPMTWNHIMYNTPTHCDERWPGKKIAMWDIHDNSC